MQPFTFTAFLTSNLELKEQEIQALVANCIEKTFSKDTFLLMQGDTCRHTFFVEKGLLRKYGIDENGKEHVLQFAPESWFVTDRDSAYFNRPAKYFIQALEDSRVLLLDENFITQFSKRFPKFSEFNKRLLHNHIRHQTARIYELLSATAEERYLSFIKTYPDIPLRVPQWMIASYLGIAPESLSRVRKELAQKNFRRRS